MRQILLFVRAATCVPCALRLIAIARSNESITERKKAIAALGRSVDPRVRKEREAMTARTQRPSAASY